MSSYFPVYQNILNQSSALEQSMAYHTGPGANAITQAANLLIQANQDHRAIVLVAIGASYSGCYPFVARMSAAGIHVLLEDAAELLHYTHQGFTQPALFLLVSRSGATIEITRALEVLKAGGHTLIGITNERDSPLARRCDLPLLFGGPSDDLIAIQTYLTTLLTLDILAEAIQATLAGSITVNPWVNPDGLKLLPDLVSRTLAFYREKSQEWRNTSPNFQAIYLLGRGPALASATEGALLFHEMARFPSVAFESGAFRHGAWEVVDARLRIFVFAPPDQTYDLNLGLALDLARLGAQTVLIASSRPDSLPDRLDFWPIFGKGTRFSAYLEIIPLQFFAYELALSQGLTPGEFRASTPVILTEK